ncbi:MAG: ABC transporter substrate binding protein [Elusimicrobiales bacterium]|nr:ABC transporter substrate binding protein [Elusimicrobiales bacterium]
MIKPAGLKKKSMLAGLASCILLVFSAGELPAADLAAVVSGKAGPYAAAYAAFSDALGMPHDFYDASAPDFAPPADILYAVAFGAKAAAVEYPPGTRLIYALAPVTARSRSWHEISMAPQPAEALAAYKKLQPGLKQLAVFWAAYPGEKYMEELRRAGEAAGIGIISAKLKSPDSFPERLRYLMGKMDAFWLMPDPVLITQSSLMMLANFSCSNGIPFYAPTYALVVHGATASFAPDFPEAGAAAARVIAALRRGDKLPPVTYPERTTLRVNEELRDKCRWPLARK